MNSGKVVETNIKILEQSGRFKIADNIKKFERKTNKKRHKKQKEENTITSKEDRKILVQIDMASV